MTVESLETQNRILCRFGSWYSSRNRYFLSYLVAAIVISVIIYKRKRAESINPGSPQNHVELNQLEPVKGNDS